MTNMNSKQTQLQSQTSQTTQTQQTKPVNMKCVDCTPMVNNGWYPCAWCPGWVNDFSGKCTNRYCN